MNPTYHCKFDKLQELTNIREHPSNPNRHTQKQIDALGKIIEKTGWRHPIIISTLSNCIVAGHCRLYAARALKQSVAPVVYQEFSSKEEELSFLLADNRLAEFSTRDDATVAAILKELDASDLGIDLSGYDQTNLSGLLAKFEPSTVTAQVPEVVAKVAELQKKWQTAKGQCWQLGRHTLVIGDSRQPEVWKQFPEGTIRLIFTDPPYGIDYENDAGQSVANDHLKRDQLADFLQRAMREALPRCSEDVAVFIWHASSTRKDFEFACSSVGLIERQYITWVKEGFVLGRCDYHWQTEHAFYMERSGHTARYLGDRTQSSVWRIQGVEANGNGLHIGKDGVLITDGQDHNLMIKEGSPPKAAKLRHFRVPEGESIICQLPGSTTAWQITRDSTAEYLHPNQKPTGLAVKAIGNHTRPGDIVVDFFGGSGSTLLAAEQTGRVCHTIELDPGYAAIIIERWHLLTKAKPHLAIPLSAAA